MIINKCTRCGREHEVVRGDYHDGSYYCKCGGAIEPFAVCPCCGAKVSLERAKAYGFEVKMDDTYICPSCYEEAEDELDGIQGMRYPESTNALREWLFWNTV